MEKLASMQGTCSNIPAFALHRPTGLAEARALAAGFGADGAVMGGGVDLMQALKSGRAIAHLIYLKSVPALRRIEAADGALRIGACATHGEIEASPVVARLAPDLARVWRELGNVRVRAAGTIGGNLLAGDRSYDGLPALIALGATAILEGPDGARRVAAVDLERDRGCDLLAAIEVPPKRRLSFDRTLKPAVSVALAVDLSGDGAVALRAGVGCARPSPVGGALAVEDGLPLAELAARSGEIAAAFAEAVPAPDDDAFASASYRRRMIAVLLGRQLRALGDAAPCAK